MQYLLINQKYKYFLLENICYTKNSEEKLFCYLIHNCAYELKKLSNCSMQLNHLGDLIDFHV